MDTFLKKLTRVVVLFMVIWGFSKHCDAKSLSGRYFVFCFPTNRGPPERARSLNIQLHSSNSNITRVTIEAPGISWFKSISLDGMAYVTVPPEAEASAEETIQNGTVTITSDQDISVTAISYTAASLSSLAVAPFESISGQRFYIINFQPAPIYPAEIMLTSDYWTDVMIKAHQEASLEYLQFPGHFKYQNTGGMVKFAIAPKQSLQIRCKCDNCACTGFEVLANNPITVLSGGECTYITSAEFDCDHVAAYIPPIDQLGRHFTAAPFPGRESGYILRLLAVFNETYITIGSTKQLLMNEGEFDTKDIEDQRIVTIISSKPIMVVQFAKGHTSDSQPGDPLMLVIPPQEQWVRYITFASFPMDAYQITRNFLSISVACEHIDTIVIDSEFGSGSGSDSDSDNEFHVEWMDILSNGNNCFAITEILPTHHMTRISLSSSEAKFSAYINGAGESVSYGHFLNHNFDRLTCTLPQCYLREDYCPGDSTLDEEIGWLTWPRTNAGSVAQSNERCPINTQFGGSGKATRRCNYDKEEHTAQWEPYQVHECGENRQVELDDLPETPVVEDNVEEVANALLECTGDLSVVTTHDVENVAGTLENIVAVHSPSKEVTVAVVETINNLLDREFVFSSNAADSTSSIVQSLESQVKATLQNVTRLRIIERAVAVDALTIRSPNDTVGGLTFVVQSGGEKDVLSEKNVKTIQGERMPTSVETSIELPESIFSGTKDMQVSFKVFKQDSLFISNKTIRNWTVAGSVVSAEILGTDTKKLQSPVIVKFLPFQIPGFTDSEELMNKSTCVFWDFELKNGIGDWSSDGCKLAGFKTGRIICECTHLTNFAVIVDITGHDLTGVAARVLDIITYVGCSISIASLIITLAIFLGFRKLRKARQRAILIHFCFSLLFLYIVFVFGVDNAVNSNKGCVTVAALIHYFTLTTMMWMGVEARNLYSKLVTVFDPETDWFMKVAFLTAWVLPAAVVGITVGIGHADYTDENYCFISAGPLLYFSLLLPIGVILMHNFVTFVAIMYSITRGRMKSGVVNKNNSSRKELYSRLQNAVTISVLLGLTWVFGFFAIGVATTVFQVIFCLCNSLQGLLIFLLFCCRAEDVKKTMKPHFQWVPSLTRETSYDVGKHESSLHS